MNWKHAATYLIIATPQEQLAQQFHNPGSSSFGIRIQESEILYLESRIHWVLFKRV